MKLFFRGVYFEWHWYIYAHTDILYSALDNNVRIFSFYIFDIMESQVPEAGDIIVFSERLLFIFIPHLLCFVFVTPLRRREKL